MEHKETLNFAENPETVISGSFRKHMEQIGKALEGFEKADVKVLAPTTKEAINPDEKFIILAASFGLEPVGAKDYFGESSPIECAGKSYTFAWLVLKKIN